jgi:hypothetical protein
LSLGNLSCRLDDADNFSTIMIKNKEDQIQEESSVEGSESEHSIKASVGPSPLTLLTDVNLPNLDLQPN